MSLPFTFMHTTFPKDFNFRIHHYLLITDDYDSRNDIISIDFYFPSEHRYIVVYAVFKIIQRYVETLIRTNVWFWVDKHFFDDSVTEELGLTIQYKRYIFSEPNFPFEIQKVLYYGYRNNAHIHSILNKFSYSIDGIFEVIPDV